MRIPSGTLALTLLLAAGCAAPSDPPAEGEKAPDGKATAAPQANSRSSSTSPQFSDSCDLPSLGTAMFACLLPGSDPRHDSSRRVAPDIDCFWQAKPSMDKDLRADATGAWLAFTFHVENKCAATDVEVEFASPSLGTLAKWQCIEDVMPIPRSSSNSLTCHSSYTVGTITRTRGYELRVVKVNGQVTAPVVLDPEIVLEKSGSEGIIPEFTVGQRR